MRKLVKKKGDCTMEEPSVRKNMLTGVKKTHVCLDSFLTWGARMPPSVQIQQSHFLRGDKDVGSLVCADWRRYQWKAYH